VMMREGKVMKKGSEKEGLEKEREKSEKKRVRSKVWTLFVCCQVKSSSSSLKQAGSSWQRMSNHFCKRTIKLAISSLDLDEGHVSRSRFKRSSIICVCSCLPRWLKSSEPHRDSVNVPLFVCLGAAGGPIP